MSGSKVRLVFVCVAAALGVAEIPGGKSAIGAGGVVLVPATPGAGANVARWRAVEWAVKR